MEPLSIALGLAQAAPAVIQWFKGDDGPGDRKVGKLVADVARAVTGKPDPQDAIAAINADPALALEFQKALKAHEADLEQAYLSDRQDARARDVALRQNGGTNWRADVLAILSIAGLIALIATLLFVSIPDGPARDLLLVLSGTLVAVVKDVYAFEFGSSRGSKDKDRILGQRQ